MVLSYSQREKSFDLEPLQQCTGSTNESIRMYYDGTHIGAKIQWLIISRAKIDLLLQVNYRIKICDSTVFFIGNVLPLLKDIIKNDLMIFS